MRNALIIFILSLFFLVQCKKEHQPVQQEQMPRAYGKVVARYAENTLYLRDILPTLPSELSAEDSVQFLKRFAERWVRDQVILDQAEEAFRSDLDLNTKVEDYRSSLLLSAWESDYVKKNLNTTVRPIEIQNYYDLHQSDFTLDEPIVQGIFLKVKGDRNTTEPIESDWKKREPIMDLSPIPDSLIIQSYQQIDSWFRVSEWLAHIPTSVTNRSGFRKDRFMIKEHDGHIYMLRIDDKIDAGDIAPLEYVEEEIQDIVLHRRKLKMLKTHKQKLFEQAVTANRFDINI